MNGSFFPDVAALDRTEKEHLVFLDRPAELAAKLVPLET